VDWQAFNHSINGALLQPMPPSYQCHKPYYDEVACNQTALVYHKPIWREAHPLAMQYPFYELDENHKGCYGTDRPNEYCYRGNLPYYVVNVTSISQVQDTIRFANKHNLRIVVKNTGHHTRSTAKAAVSLWMHHFRGVEFAKSFTPEGCTESAGLAAVLDPGVVAEQVLKAGDKEKLVTIVGTCPTVGIAGGFIQGGGHGLLGRTFGMASDNALQFKVVTADGNIVVANKCQNKDLFWALRGGGPGTFGVVVQTVVKAFKSPSLVGSAVLFNTSTEALPLFIRKFVEEYPKWSDAGWSGYMSFDHGIPSWVGMNPTTTSVDEAHKSQKEFFDFVNSTPGMSYKILDNAVFHSYLEYLRIPTTPFLSVPQPAPYREAIFDNFFMAGWLMPRRLYEGAQIENHAKVLTEVVMKNPYFMIMGIGGGAVATKADEEDTSVNPAFRKALTFYLFGDNMPYGATLAERTRVSKAVSTDAQLFRDLAPESGSYLNEADEIEPNWQRAFWGEHYPRLLEIKETYDPDRLFVCAQCVGSEGRSADLNCKV
jgi:FAD/FMN-containing dehydrogenase